MRLSALRSSTLALAMAASGLSLGACLVGGKLTEETKRTDAGGMQSPTGGSTRLPVVPATQTVPTTPAPTDEPVVTPVAPRSSTGPCQCPEPPPSPPSNEGAAVFSPPSGMVISSVNDAGIVTYASFATAGTLVTLASGQISPYVLAIDSTSVYWADWGTGSAQGDGAIDKVSIEGGAVTTLVPGQRMPGGIAVDSTSVYWSTVGASGLGVYSVALGGGTPTLVATGFTNDPIAVGPSGVYGTNGSDAPVSAPLQGGGAATVLAPGPGNSNTYGIAVDSTSVYWTDFNDPGVVSKVPRGGGQATTLATGHVAFGIAVDATSVYWVNGGGASAGSLMKVARSGGTPVTLAMGFPGPIGLAIDAQNAYVTVGGQSNTGGWIVKVPLRGGNITTLVGGLNQPYGIAVDATSVYWTTLGGTPGGGGTIMKLTPK
jgi:hypothetical protein